MNNAHVDVGVWLQPTGNVRQVVERAVLAESSGLDFVGITDGQMIWNEVYICLTAVAQATSYVRVGPWVTNAVTRHPTVTASALCSLDDVSDGRAFLGIGNGDDSVLTIGKKRRSLDGLAADVETISALSRGDIVEREGARWTLAAARPAAPPIYWAANGPRALFYAGKFAAGVIHSGWLLPSLMRSALDIVADGARAGGRRPSDIIPIFNTAVVIDDDGKRARDSVKAYVARGLIYRTSVQIPGWTEEYRQRLLAAYNYYNHLSTDHSVVNMVPDELVTSKAVAGTSQDVIAQLQSIIDAGYRQIALLPMGDVETVIERLAADVMPHLQPSNMRLQPQPHEGDLRWPKPTR